MLDILIIEQIKEKERKRQEWQPQPLYLPLEDPQPPRGIPSEEHFDIWGPQEDNNGIIVIDTGSYFSQNNYQI